MTGGLLNAPLADGAAPVYLDRMNESVAPKVVAVIEQYDDLAAALRRWFLDDLKTTFAAIDEVSGLTDGYCAKLLGAEPLKRLGPISLPLMLSAAGSNCSLLSMRLSLPGSGTGLDRQSLARRSLRRPAPARKP
jgi:hypothetical protein